MPAMQIDIDVTPVEPGLVLMRPLTYGGRRWFEDNVNAASPKYGDSYVIQGDANIDFVFGELIEEGLVAV